MASNADASGLLTSEVTFSALMGTDYQIAVDGFAGDSGAIVLTLHALTPATNPRDFLERILGDFLGSRVRVVLDELQTRYSVGGCESEMPEEVCRALPGGKASIKPQLTNSRD